MSVVDILLEKRIIDKGDLTDIRKRISAGVSMEDALLATGVSPVDIISAKSEFLEIPVKTIEDGSVPYDVLDYIPEESAIHYGFVPLGVDEGVLEVGFVDPDNIEARDALNFLAAKKNIPYKIFLITKDDFEKVIKIYGSVAGQVKEAVEEFQSELKVEKIDRSSIDSIGTKGTDKSGAIIVEDAPIKKVMDTIISYAVDGDVSDVHIEPMADKVRVRYRVDGILNTSIILPKSMHSHIAQFIKGKASLKYDEKRRPQDGRFNLEVDGRKIDFRVSTFPTNNGEKVEFRILDQARGVKKLNDMGMTPRNLAMLREAINKPYGLVLITGPTGSGKSTTLYSIMNEMDRESYNILSLEDPVEYSIDGVNQSQVHPAIGYTFDSGLRTTLRQDPDIIMVGEIRDKETAKLAVQAALTGHLVLSTLHTNSASGVIPRLIDMGVDPYLIAPTLVLAAAQRLVGVMVPEAGEEVPVQGSIKSLVDNTFADLPDQYRKEIVIPEQIFKLKANPKTPRGTRGRTAVFEMFKMDKDIEQMILKNPVESEIYKVARSKGMLTLQEDALLKAFKGQIPLEEVHKLTGTDDSMVE